MRQTKRPGSLGVEQPNQVIITQSKAPRTPLASRASGAIMAGRAKKKCLFEDDVRAMLGMPKIDFQDEDTTLEKKLANGHAMQVHTVASFFPSVVPRSRVATWMHLRFAAVSVLNHPVPVLNVAVNLPGCVCTVHAHAPCFRVRCADAGVG